MYLQISSFLSKYFLRSLIFSFILVCIFLTPLSLVIADVTGKPRVIDGDTIEIAGTLIRLDGIDAPETKQMCLDEVGKRWRCGEAATYTLLNIIGNHWVTCKGEKRDRYRRLIAICTLGPFDLNAMLVLKGLALAYRKYSIAYIKEEYDAKSKKLGLWRGRFVAPWEWRQGKRLIYNKN
jgi:endonuclease YncB( thermonuclease family)